MTNAQREHLDQVAAYRPRMPQTHEVKCWPEFYNPAVKGQKPFELRNNDRNYQEGDILKMREWCPEFKGYTGSEACFRITYVLKSSAFLQPGIVALGIAR